MTLAGARAWQVAPGIAAHDGAGRHVPVLRSEALGALGLVPGGRYVDGTFGAGGYTSQILAAFPDTRVLALDRDRTAVVAGAPLVEAADGRLVLAEANFAELGALAEQHGLAPLDGVVLDLGLSSMQLDGAERGFSFRQDGPLDMRMGQHGTTAAELVATLDEPALASVLRVYGEERMAGAIARAIVRARAEAPLSTTRALAALIERIMPPRFGQVHPATRTFQALRIAVNDELVALVRALEAAERVLAPGGRLVVVSFHSLEDRIVKRFLAGPAVRASRHQPAVSSAEPAFLTPGRWPVAPADDEVAANPRARSAKLRLGLRTRAPARSLDPALMALATLPVSPRRTGPSRRP